MDKSKVKNFATSARNKLIEGVRQKAYGLGISDKEIKTIENLSDGSRLEINNEYKYLTNSEAKNRDKLIEQIETKGYEQVMEEVAYTWFNRIIAIRFMEVNDYLPTGVRVLSSETASKVEPDAVTQAHSLIEELELHRDTVFKFQDNNDSEGLFKYILIKQCNALGNIMPVMFEKIEDYTELLLPDNLLVEGSVVRDLVSNISEEDFKEQVEIIGWLYQYYISEKKDEVFADLKNNKKITKENIPAATQLFTPDWIVKYMVENSLGRLWLEGHPNEELQSGWKYYLEEAKQEPEVETELEKIREESKSLSPEEITVLDPSMGSGHILVYAFDVLYQIYLRSGYSEREIPRLILEKNIYGLDIDDRAGQLAYFALMMKARSYSRRIFRDMERNPISLNVCSIQESNGLSKVDVEYFANGDESLKKDVEYLVDVFTDAKEYGSILEVEEVDFEKIENRLVEIEEDIADLFSKENRERILGVIPSIVNQGKVISKKYDVCITNPPYMGSKGMNTELGEFVKKKYPNSKSDLCMTFIERGLKYTSCRGILSLVTMHSWMFLSSYEKLRIDLIQNSTFDTLLHLGMEAFENIVGKVVQTVAFTVRKRIVSKYKSTNVRLVDFYDSRRYEKEIRFFDQKYRHVSCQEKFKSIPGTPIAYWASDLVKVIFEKADKLGDVGQPQQGLSTTDNNRFIRMWSEVSSNKIGYNILNSEELLNKHLKWVPINKGGNFRKWYGNNDSVLNWENDGFEIKQNVIQKYPYLNGKYEFVVKNEKNYFKRGITWSKVTTYLFSTRYTDVGFIFTDAGMKLTIDDELIKYAGAFMNTKLVNELLKFISETMNYEQGNISKLPFIVTKDNNLKLAIENLFDMNICISKKDWDSFETSWDFTKHPIIEFKSNSIENSFNNWTQFTEKQFNQLKSNEEELNRIFIDIYGLQDELTPEVEDKDVTTRKADRDRDIKSFISYAVGCMMGRYTLDVEGLAFAGGDFDINKYKIFEADEDAIIPITDTEYFEDDIVSKFVEFVEVVFSKDTLEENLNYIADTECFKRKANETSRDCLRRYFLKGFMEDHLKVYQKRPIYWMFDSGKQNGFKALIYMHRYNESMVAKIRTDYLHTLQRKYESEIDRLDNDMNSEVVTAKEKAAAKKRKEVLQKQLVECVAYDQVIAHVAHQRIGIDLDDGVKVNYQKFQEVEVPQGDGKKDLKADLLFKVKM
ncbi:BREX-1 system adenine-specific DNA-methyltransferase PglX [Romboutsia sp.]|uniref:BREX-1 system adenine-specific DNA-methyltransferase PglX n=1 Tax=Romboutsia sp. TaxID=1965302 RepID=UPI003F393C78